MRQEIKQQIKEFDRVIKKYPYVNDLYIGRAILYSQLGEYEKAVKDYEIGCEKYLYCDLMITCKRNNLIEEMEEFYTNEINEDKDNVVNYMSRARLYITIGEDKKALADCETILKICPENKFFLGMKKALMKKIKERERKTKQMKELKLPEIFLK